jgi:hypothetical protein
MLCLENEQPLTVSYSVIRVVLVFLGLQNTSVMWGMEASTQISKESLGGQIMCDEVRVLAGSP